MRRARKGSLELLGYNGSSSSHYKKRQLSKAVISDSDEEEEEEKSSSHSEDSVYTPSRLHHPRVPHTRKAKEKKHNAPTPSPQKRHISPFLSPEGPNAKALGIARKLGFQSDQTRDYTDWVVDLKDKFITIRHSEIIEGPKSLQDRGRHDLWQAAIQDLVNEEPRFNLKSFGTYDVMARAAHELLKNQAKKVRLRKSVKPIAEGSGAKRNHEVFEDEPRSDQATAVIDLSTLPSPNFTVALWREGFKMPFLSQITPLADIKDLQDWVCTKLEIPSGTAMVEAMFPVLKEDYFDILGVVKSGDKARLDVSDQASWNSVISLAQQVVNDPTKFVGLRLEARQSTAGELRLRWDGRKPPADGPEPKRSKLIPQDCEYDKYDDNTGNNNENNDNSTHSRNCSGKDPEYIIDAPTNGREEDEEGEGEEDEEDPVVENDQMQGILDSFHEEDSKEDEKPVIDLDILLGDEEGKKDKSDQRHRDENNPGGLGEGQSTTNENDFFGLCISNYNNDFEHECFNEALRCLRAKAYDPIAIDDGIQRFSIPGCGKIRFYPHQVWGIQFVVQRIINEDGLNSCLVADDMGMGKTFVALGALLHIKWLVHEADEDLPLPCCAGKRPSEMPNHSFFSHHLVWAKRPTIIVVPPSLLITWSRTLVKIPELNVIILHKKQRPTSQQINNSDAPEYMVYLTSYHTWKSRQDTLKNARFGVGIFDESHHVKNRKTQAFNSLIKMNCKYRVQLSGTPMHHGVRDWVVQAQWLHAESQPELLDKHGYEVMEAACDIVKKSNDASPSSYKAIRDCVYPWTIRRWGETTLADGKPLISIPELVTENIVINYTEEEAMALNLWVKEEKERSAQKYNSALHGWRLASFYGDLPETERKVVNGNSVFREEWDASTFKSSPIFRWLEKKLVPLLIARPEVSMAGELALPHKAVLFAPLPGQTFLVNWWFKAFFPRIECYHFKAKLSGPERLQCLEAFDTSKKPSVLVITPALGGNGINLICADNVVILQKFWNMNEQKQAIARIHRIGQKRKSNAFILHTKGGIDDRITELQMANGRFEAKLMHGLMGVDLSYEQIMDMRATRLQNFLETNTQSVQEGVRDENGGSEKEPDAN